MNRWRACGSVLAIFSLALAGCNKTKSNLPPTVPAAQTNTNPFVFTKAQPKLTTMKLWLGAQELDAELAITSMQVATGMMFRKTMAESEGMLFIFGRPHRANFYMKNTLLPLSCAYLDSEGIILEIHDMKPLDESPIEAQTDQIQYVLEVKQGWFERNKIGVGTLIRTERGSLAETFFRAR